MRKIGLVFFVVFFGVQHIAYSELLDSLRTESKAGKLYVIHKVDSKETLYSLSKRYDVSIKELTTSNPFLEDGLKFKQILSIPLSSSTSELAKVETTTPQKAPPTKIVSSPVVPNQYYHTVTAGETLYGIARKYEVDVTELKKFNNLADNTIFKGQKIAIVKSAGASVAVIETAPVKTTQVKTTPVANNVDQPEIPAAKESNVSTSINRAQPVFTSNTNDRKIHQVSSQETLYSIAKAYDLSLFDLKKWNGLSNDQVVPGQKLIVGLNPMAVDNKVPVEKDLSKDEKQLASQKEIMKANKKKKKKKPSPNIDSNQPVPVAVKNVDNKLEKKKVSQKGLAEVIETSSSSKRYSALHKSAPIGTIVEVRNEMNNVRIFVRVIGKLIDSSSDENVLLKISKPAFEKLAAIDKRFPVEISYIP